MIRAITLATVFAISLLAIPTNKTSTGVVPMPTCNPCPDYPWSN